MSRRPRLLLLKQPFDFRLELHALPALLSYLRLYETFVFRSLFREPLELVSFSRGIVRALYQLYPSYRSYLVDRRTRGVGGFFAADVMTESSTYIDPRLATLYSALSRSRPNKMHRSYRTIKAVYLDLSSMLVSAHRFIYTY